MLGKDKAPSPYTPMCPLNAPSQLLSSTSRRDDAACIKKLSTPPHQSTLSARHIDLPHHLTLSTHFLTSLHYFLPQTGRRCLHQAPLNPLYQPIISTRLINPPFQPLSSLPIIPPAQPTLSSHPLNSSHHLLGGTTLPASNTSLSAPTSPHQHSQSW